MRSIIKAFIAINQSLGGDKSFDILRVMRKLFCQGSLTFLQDRFEERIAIACQNDFMLISRVL